jgi:DNA mismatch repair protein MutL
MSVIRILPAEVVNRIQAGEIVERPASVLKEIIENAIDAAATEISADLEEGGKKLILVRDNGSGIALDDLPLAFERHATSKLSAEQVAENLMGVATLGFRGEALASIASVAMVEVVTRAPGTEHAWRFSPGSGPPRPAPGEPGTAIEVRNLFYSVPARRKFLRSTSTELSSSVQQFTRLAMGFPGIQFRLRHGGKPLLDLSPAESLRDRLRQLLGKETAAGLLELKARTPLRGAPTISGFVGNHRLHRKDSRGQNFFVNGRWVRDKIISAALRSAYQGFQIPGNQPLVYLFLEIPPADVDVNVHPTKTEVRFRDSSAVYQLVHGSIREALNGDLEPSRASSDDPRAKVVRAAEEFLARPRPERAFYPAASPRWSDSREPGQRPAASSPRVELPLAGKAAEIVEIAAAAEPKPPRAFQVLQSYLVVEALDGLVVVDQHALHEKILFEEIFRKLGEGVVESQRLLVPEVIDLAPELMPLIEPARALLEPLGFEIDAFGPAAAAVHAFPALFDREAGRTDLKSIVRSLLESLLEESGSKAAVPQPVRDELRRLAALMACKRAVKAGMPLSQEEVDALLLRGELAEDPRHCPHGRPTTLFLSRRDMERQFDRK